MHGKINLCLKILVHSLIAASECAILEIYSSDFFYSLVINLETEKGKSGATSFTSVPGKETTLQPVVDEADGKLSYNFSFFFFLFCQT